MSNAPLVLPQRKRVVGESLVWLTAMGLAVGLLMVIGLLSIIVGHGVDAFWPRQVERLELSDGSVVLGEIVQQRVKHEPGANGAVEVQVFTGNKDAFGGAFRFIDNKLIKSRSIPVEVIELERVEYGNAIGTPVRLVMAGSEKIEANAPDFRSKLLQLVAEVNERRDAIIRLEKGEIGENSKRLTVLEYELKGLEARNQGQSAEAQAIQTKATELKAAYQKLAITARELRAKQKQHAMILRLADNSERKISIGAIISVSAPNEWSWIGQLGEFFHRIGRFLSENPREANTEGGIFPAIFGTFVMTILMSAAVTPFGVVAAIYLREYAKQGPMVRGVRIAVNNLAGVPSIVFGVFGLGFFVYIVGGTIDSLFFADKLPNPTFGTGGILWSAMTLALMTVPVVIVATEEAIAAVPRGAKEGSLAMGASKWQTIRNIVLPAAVPGILTGLILAMARGAGEVAPLMLVGVVKLAPTLPLNGDWPFFHLDQKFMHLGFHIYDLGFQSPDSEAAKPMVFATTLFLIGLVLALNLSAIILREKLRKRFATGAF